MCTKISFRYNAMDISSRLVIHGPADRSNLRLPDSTNAGVSSDAPVQNQLAHKLLGCAIMRRSQRRWLFGTEVADTGFSEQRFSELKFCAAASTLTRNFLNSSSSRSHLPVAKSVVTLVNRFQIKCV